MWKITPDHKQGLEGARVRVKASGKLGTIVTVLPGADGSPWSLHVRLDDEAHDAPPLVLAPDEVSRMSFLN